MIPFVYACELTGLLSFGFVVALLLMGPRRPVNLLWCMTCLSIGLYSLGQGKSVSSYTAQDAFFWLTWFQYLGANMIPVLFLHFITLVLEVKRHRLIVMGYLCAAVLQCLSFSGRLFYARVYPPFRFYDFPLPAYSLYVVYFFGLVIYSLWLLYRHMRSASGQRRNQLEYLFWATTIGYLGGATTFFPLVHIPIFPYGVFAIPVYILGTSYAIIKHQLMDIHVVIRKTLLYSIMTAGFASAYAGAVTLLAHLLEQGPASSSLFPTELLGWLSHHMMISFAYSCLATALFSIGFGIFVALKDPHKTVNLLWCGLCLAIGVWSLGQGMVVCSSSIEKAYFWMRWAQYSGAFLIPILFLQFVARLINRPSRVIVRAGYVLVVIQEALLMAGWLVIVKPSPPFNYYDFPGRYYALFMGYFFSFVIYAHVILFRAMQAAEGRLKQQIKYIFVGTTISFLGACTAFFPEYGIPIFPFGIYAVSLYILTVSYAIFKHQLMDINVVIRKTLLYSLVSAALASIYVGTITLLAHLLQSHRGSATAYTSALAAVFITLLFNPLRTRLQMFIDRKFTRERVDLEEKMAEFSAAVVNEHNAAKVTHALFRVLEKGFRPKAIALYEKIGDGKGFGKSDSLSLPWPELEDGDSAIRKLVFDASPDYPLLLSPEDAKGSSQLWQAGVRVVIPLQSRGEWIGALLLGEKKSEEDYSNEDLVLLRIIANQAAVAYERPKLVREVSGGFVHEVKMPLSKISLPAELTYLEISRALQESGEPDEFLEKIQRRMQFIMDQAKLAAQRVDALRELGSSRENLREPKNLADILVKSMSSVDDLLTREHVTAIVDIPAQLPSVRAEADQLEILFTNLLKNAVESMASLPAAKVRQIHVRARQAEGRIWIEVEDSGSGVPKEERELIFQPYYTTKGANGTGMGLFLCRQIAQAHGGTIQTTDKEGSGTIFEISFPLTS